MINIQKSYAGGYEGRECTTAVHGEAKNVRERMKEDVLREGEFSHPCKYTSMRRRKDSNVYYGAIPDSFHRRCFGNLK
jgi:hypothetical protein